MPQSKLSTQIRKAAPSQRFVINAVLACGTLGAAAWLLLGEQASNPPPNPPPAHTTKSDSRATLVKLPAKKLAAAAIKTYPVSMRSLTHTHTVPGRLDYDAARRLDLRLPTDCVVQEVRAAPGRRVEQGATLAVLTSEQIGLARDGVKQAEETLQIAKYNQAWADKIVANVEALLVAFEQHPAVAQLETNFRKRQLGQHRGVLLGAYSDFLLAEKIQADSNTLSERNVLSGRITQERQAKLEKARAAFQGGCEETTYHVRLDKQKMDIEVASAERTLKIGRERLAALLGPYAGSRSDDADAPLNEFVLTAPFTGNIEARYISKAEVVAANSPLFTLADTSQLWVSAQIREQEWSAVSLVAGQPLRVRTPATGEREFTATVDFVGAVVDPTTRALPLVAVIDNKNQLLKPGMFVWVSLPIEPSRNTIAIPSSAVVRHEDQAFVFVEEDNKVFRRIDVTTGLETEEWTEVRSGLDVGQKVASSGVFVLKSELLLEREDG